MAAEFMDSADHYQDSTVQLSKWTQSFFAGSNATGRNGRGIGLTFSGSFVRKTITHVSKRGVQFSARFLGSPFGAASPIFDVKHVGTTLASVYVEPDGTVTLWGGSRTQFLDTTDPFVLSANVDYHFAITVQVFGSAPISAAVTLQINGVERASGSGVTGVNQSSLLLQQTTQNVFSIYGININASTIVDDVFVWNDTGGSVTDFPGDLAIGVLFPDGDVTTGWNPSVAGTHFSLVNEQFPNADSTYVESSTPATVENYNWQDVSFTGEIVAVHLGALARKTDEGTRTFKLTVGETGSYDLESAEFSPGDSYLYFFICMDEDPLTNLPWTQPNFNAKKFGWELIT